MLVIRHARCFRARYRPFLSCLQVPLIRHAAYSASRIGARTHSQQAESGSGSKSIFDSDESTWEHVFKDLDSASKDLLVNPGPERKAKRPRAQQMTAFEIGKFGDMYDMVFNAVRDDGSATPPFLPGMPTIDNKSSVEISNLAMHLRHRSREVKWTTEAAQELDRKKEQMDLCQTDLDLLEWSVREVFGESQRYERQARLGSPSARQSQQPAQLQPLSYPHVIANLMRIFRDKYANPHLALSIFDHARYLSIASYVFGCTSHAYNELIETRWRCFRDLRGACNALEEMRVNGIEMDNKTRTLAELVRREVGERNLWEEETSVGRGEVWQLVTRIEQLATTRPANRPLQQKKWSSASWRHEAVHDSAGSKDTWSFNGWDNVA